MEVSKSCKSHGCGLQRQPQEGSIRFSGSLRIVSRRSEGKHCTNKAPQARRLRIDKGRHNCCSIYTEVNRCENLSGSERMSAITTTRRELIEVKCKLRAPRAPMDLFGSRSVVQGKERETVNKLATPDVRVNVVFSGTDQLDSIPCPAGIA
jgi:hypothetical protein